MPWGRDSGGMAYRWHKVNENIYRLRLAFNPAGEETQVLEIAPAAKAK